MSVLVLADVDGGKLTAATARVVATAAEFAQAIAAKMEPR
jgi:hypothetical protein